jgi:uncharacterized protein DUF5661
MVSGDRISSVRRVCRSRWYVPTEIKKSPPLAISRLALSKTWINHAEMNIPEYVTKEEVRRVCSAIGIRDWTALTEAKVEIQEANMIKMHVGGETLAISTEDFPDGLEIELEHGLAFPDANVTNNHPILTGRIVLAHLKETLDYYSRLRVAEIEGDMLKALVGNDPEKLILKYRLWVAARAELAERERAIAGQKCA